MHPTMHNRLLGAISLAFLVLASPAAASRTADEQVMIVADLYKAFAWQALSNSNDVFGKPLSQQESSILQRYFDKELASLLVKDRHCIAQTGEICNLDFDPIFAGQDPAAADLSIRSTPNDFVAVEFTYPSNGEKVRLEYRLVKSQVGWRIGDIRYPGMSDISLKQILARTLPACDKLSPLNALLNAPSA